VVAPLCCRNWRLGRRAALWGGPTFHQTSDAWLFGLRTRRRSLGEAASSRLEVTIAVVAALVSDMMGRNALALSQEAGKKGGRARQVNEAARTRLLLNRYYGDALYAATIVQNALGVHERALDERGRAAIDGAVMNGLEDGITAVGDRTRHKQKRGGTRALSGGGHRKRLV